MDAFIFAVTWQDLWSILAIVLLIGPMICHLNLKLFRQYLLAGQSNFLIFLSEYSLGLELMILIFGDMNHSIYDLSIITFVLVSFLNSWATWSKLSNETKVGYRFSVRWLGVVGILILLTSSKFEIHSWLQISRAFQFVWNGLLVGLNIVENFIALFVGKLHYRLAWPSIIFAGVFIPIWTFLHWDHSIVAVSFSRKIRIIITVIIEYVVVALIVAWFFYGRIPCDNRMIAPIIISVGVVPLIWYILAKTSYEFKHWLKGIVILCAILGVFVAICQIAWDVNAFTAVRIFFKNVIIGGLLFLQGTSLWKFFSLKWKAILAFFRGFGWKQIIAGLVWLVRKFSIRGSIKLGTFLGSIQIFSIKPVKHFVKKNMGVTKEFVAVSMKQAQNDWEKLGFWTRFFSLLIIMYLLLFISPWQIFWPMLPAGSKSVLFGIFKGVKKMAGMMIRKVFSNSVVDGMMVFIAKRLSVRITKLSPDMKRKVRIILVWRLGRRLIKHNRKRQKQFVFLSKEFRQVNRKARQLAIDQQKGIYSGVAEVAGFAADTVVGTAKVATSIANETVCLAKDGVCVTLTIAQKSTLATWRTIQNLLREALQIKEDPEKTII